MVLIRVLLVVAVIATGACKQSLFANGGGDDVQPDSQITIPATCPAGCIADAGAEFGQAGWRYLEDNRKRAWTPMTMVGATATGADPANTITSCATRSDAAACTRLQGALLVSSSGATATADPAIELTIKANQVVKIDLAAVLSSGASQPIRLYRNSREDVLYTGTVDAGQELATSITLDVLKGDRILVAVAPSTTGAMDVAIQLFVSPTGAAFPADCELALAFPPITGTTTHDACGNVDYAYMNDTASAAASIVDVAPPYPELGRGVQIASDDFFQAANVLDRHGDTTTQLWLQQIGLVNGNAGWFFTDMDLDSGGGVGIDVGLDADSLPIIETYSGTQAGTVVGISGALATDPHGWHFVRVVYTNGTLSLCLDGTFVKSMALPTLTTTYPTFLGKDHQWTPVGAFVNGAIDDVRVVKGALPCK